MARIAGINIPMNKHVWVGLTHIYGVGRSRARSACVAAGVDPSTKVKDLTEAEVNSIRSQIAKYAVEGDLRADQVDRKSTRLNSSHRQISHAVFCFKKKN